jgi:peptidoglycan hydrolase-like protein with peptidoglycan-binding domain
VTALQNYLIASGYSIPAGATGYFGLETKLALAEFQAANSISPTSGYLGPITQAFINSHAATASAPTTETAPITKNLAVGSQNSQVTTLQTILAKLGFFTNTVTGYFGSITQAAVKAFQASKGIEQVGSVGPLTRAALNAVGM